MKIEKLIKGFAVGLGVLVVGAYSASCQTTYTDTQGDQVGSANALRDLWSATFNNDANNLYLHPQYQSGRQPCLRWRI